MTRIELVRRMREQREHIVEWFADLEHWNRTRPDEAFTLSDVDPGGLMAQAKASLDLSIAQEEGFARMKRESARLELPYDWDA